MTSITELEHRLSGPDAGNVKQHLLLRLQQMELRMREQLRLGRGVAADQFETIQACAQACVAAQEVLRNHRSDS